MKDLRRALSRDQFRVTETLAFGLAGAISGLIVETKDYSDTRWRKHKTPIFPHKDQSVSDVFTMLLTIREEVRRG